MNKELEEAKRTLERIRNIYEHIKNHGWVNDITRDVNPNVATQAIETVLNYIENSIPKQIIEDETEELKEKLKNIDKPYICEPGSKIVNTIYDYKNKIQVLQELLEGK